MGQQTTLETLQYHFKRLWPRRHEPHIRHALICNLRGQIAAMGTEKRLKKEREAETP